MSENFSPHMHEITKAQRWVKTLTYPRLKRRKRKARTPRKLRSATWWQNSTNFVTSSYMRYSIVPACDLPRDTILSLFAERAFTNPRLLQWDDTCPFHLAMLYKTNACDKTAYVEAISIADITIQPLLQTTDTDQRSPFCIHEIFLTKRSCEARLVVCTSPSVK